MEFHESKTLTLPIAKQESLTVNVFLILLLIWLSFVVIGFAIDKTHSRYGKLRPWLLYGSIPLGFADLNCKK